MQKIAQKSTYAFSTQAVVDRFECDQTQEFTKEHGTCLDEWMFELTRVTTIDTN